ncbi:NAD(P)-dependent dehydrogenase (short-subunit alcohol dehydrogenase family) [Nocardia tenerifensis]|uniref:NAD(P)-dependent dehydrogenase (Short-subunit alcohol dehydrogenase family) n=1 Tax=Nocardia tenerifensis TaxID=228006 RepID=A0A318KBT8_9NOCA|nr:SDR family NAD(P)-dependent oxidoreductase [Nocardia tenerifensis]PXX54889.1 NAD(P)-dependent dehydrogenase (short-subunit alcohol dehydrogenase family) [Nocardia tenerifensis]
MSFHYVGWAPPDLRGTIALVTGASRGVGRGVALALGEAGATVYVTGRSRAGSATEELPGTVAETATEVSRRGGRGIALVCDHFDDDATAGVFRSIGKEQGRLDVLVNNAWAGYERGTEAKFDAPFWQQPMWRWDLFEKSLRGQYYAARLAVPLMQAAGTGLIANMSFTNGDTYLGQVAYDISKTSSDRMVVGMAYDLRKTSITAVSLHPGLVRTERVDAAWQALGAGPAAVAHSPEYVGRAVASLLGDPERHRWSGQKLAVGDLAQAYSFDDVDGRRPGAFQLEGRMTLATRMQRLNGIVASTRAEATVD